MGGCESCTSRRCKGEAAIFLDGKIADGSPSELRAAIRTAEVFGIDTLSARRQYAELTRAERHSPERAHEVLQWVMSNSRHELDLEDGILLYNVVQDLAANDPANDALQSARQRLRDYQEKAKRQLIHLSKNGDTHSLAVILEKAKQIGIPPSDLDRVVKMAPQGRNGVW